MSTQKKIIIGLAVLCIPLAGTTALKYAYFRNYANAFYFLPLKQAPIQVQASSPMLKVGTTTVALEIADTPALQMHGLSDRSSLDPSHAMLFTFAQPDYWGIWMKDMHFPIDIFWLDQNYNIITIRSNVSPNTYPEVFYPVKPASFVLETAAGFAETHGLTPGSHLEISGE